MDGKQLRNSILQWAIQGKLVPQDPNDEPASVLLERIREEKARLVKEKKIKRDKNESIIYRGDDNSYYEKFTNGKVVCIDDEVPFDIPFGWEWCRLGCLCSKFSTGPFGTMVHKSDYTDDGIPLVNPTNIKDQQIIAENICKVALTKYDELRAYVLSENDIVLARRGDLSKCAIVNEEQIGWLAGTGSFFMHIMELSLEFFIMLYTSPYAQDYLIGDSVGTTMNNLNQGLLSRMLIPIPPLPEQSRIIEHYRFIIPIIERYTVAYSERKALDDVLPIQIKKSVLQEAIQGKLVPQDLNDEPASILLQRIKEEKQRLVKEGKLKKKDVIDSTIFRGDDNKYYENLNGEVNDITDQIPFDIPATWQWVRLRSLCNIATGASFKKEEASVQDANKVRILRGGNIQPFRLQLKEDDIFINRELVNENILLRENDLVTPAVTSLENICKMARIEKDYDDMTMGGFVFIIRGYYNDNTLAHYLQCVFSSPTTIEFVRSITNKSGQAFYNIGKERLSNTLIPIPPFDEMGRITSKIESLFQLLN